MVVQSHLIPDVCMPKCLGTLKGDGTKVTERAQNAHLHRKPQIFANSPLLLEFQAFVGHRKPQKTADFRRKPKIFAENRRKPQIGLHHLRCVTFGSALKCAGGDPWGDQTMPQSTFIEHTSFVAELIVYTPATKYWGKFFTYSWSFLFTVKFLCLQSLKTLTRRTFPL